MPEDPTQQPDRPAGPPPEHLERASFVFEIDHAMPAEYGVVGRVVRGASMPGDHLLLYSDDGAASPVEALRAERIEQGPEPRDDVWAVHLKVRVHRYGPMGGASPRLEVSTGQLLLGFTEGQAPLRQVAAKELTDLLEARGLQAISEEDASDILDHVAAGEEARAMDLVSQAREGVPDPELLSVVRRMRRILRPDAKDYASQCFIATAACGAVDHPNVSALRLFRDGVLLRGAAGRRAVAAYVHFSPPLARWIARRPFWRAAVRLLIVRPAAWFARRVTPGPQGPER